MVCWPTSLRASSKSNMPVAVVPLLEFAQR
jgi:hypothetical protein